MAGVNIYTEFKGTSIGVRLSDNFNYFNVYVDGALDTILHGTTTGTADYTLASGLADGQHTILFSKRNENNWTVRYDYSDKPYDDMAYTFTTTGKRSHILNFSGEHGMEYTLFLTASDLNGNKTPVSSMITFSIDTTKVLLQWPAERR